MKALNPWAEARRLSKEKERAEVALEALEDAVRMTEAKMRREISAQIDIIQKMQGKVYALTAELSRERLADMPAVKKRAKKKTKKGLTP